MTNNRLSRFQQSRSLEPRGLTLLEVLVVIAIVGALLAMTLPAINRARQSSRATVSANNMRQIGIAMTMFCNENGGKFPGASWVSQIGPFLENNNDVLICPMDPVEDKRRSAKSSSYSMNENLGQKGTNSVTYIHKLSDSSKTILLFVASSASSDTVAHCSKWFSATSGDWQKILADIAPDRFGGDSEGSREIGSSNYLYVDGHVESIPASTIKQYADQNVNFAKATASR